MSEFTSTDV
jgi:hypothetical protein